MLLHVCNGMYMYIYLHYTILHVPTVTYHCVCTCNSVVSNNYS